MKLSRLTITHLPGIHGGLALDGFGAGINVVTGPNASGKSSLIRALRHLIDPAPEPSGGALTLEAEFVSGEHRWTVTRSGSEIVWQERGRRVDPPLLPSNDFLQCYWLSMDDLLDEGRTDAEIASRLKTLLAGGFDLDAVRAVAPFDIGPRHGHAQQRELAAMDTALNEVIARYEQLERERERLPDIERRIRDAEAASARAAKVRRALEWLDARRALGEIDRRLETFLPGMERLGGREVERLADLERRRRTLETRRADTERKREAARRRLDEAGLANEPPDRTDLAVMRKELDEIRDAHTRLDQYRRELIEAKAAEATAGQALGRVEERSPPVPPDSVDRAVRLAEPLREAERRVRELEALAGAASADPDAASAHETLARELRRWLRQLEPKRFARLFGEGIAALGFGVAAALSAAGSGTTAAAALAGLAATAAVCVLAELIAMRSERAAAARRAAEQPLAPPEAWTADAVARRLTEIEKEHAALLLRNERANDAAARLKDLDAVRAALESLRREKETLAREIGFDPSKSAESVARFAQLAREWDLARVRQQNVKLAHADLLRRTDERAKRVAEYLARYGSAADSSAREPHALRARLEALDDRAEAFREARREIADAELLLRGVDDDLRALGAELDQLYDDAGLERGDREGLRSRCAQFDEYRSLRDKRAQAVTVEQERRSGVADDAELLARVDDDDETGLRDLLSGLELQADTLAQDRERHANIKARLDLAGGDRALERARQAADEARERLREAYAEAMIGEAGHFLLDDVAKEHLAESEPAVLAAARERFVRFTHDRYALLVDDDGRLRARDNRYGTEHDLATLSTGTRMQLLLAARLAWTAVAEQNGESLPIMLDEALTTSDPDRFASIARNLAETAEREGRQIFYLSAEPADAIRFERALGVRPTHIDLSRAARALEPSDYALTERAPLPRPRGATPVEYAARLGVPAIDPRSEHGAIHVFYLLRDDLELLHGLVSDWRITHIGQLEAMLHSRIAEHAVPDAATRERLAARCRVAAAWIDAWRQGRGHPVDRNVLEASGAVSARFIDEVTALAARVGGDAKRLIEALYDREVQGFLRSKTEDLGDWLVEHGYLDPAQILSADARELGTLGRAAGIAPPAEIQHVVASLEAGAAGHESVAETQQEEAVDTPNFRFR